MSGAFYYFCFMNFFKRYYEQIPAFLKNKYVLVGSIIFLWVAFFDSHNLVKQSKLKGEIEDLEEKRNFYKTEIKKDSIALHELNTNPKTQEKFAREKYFMKKDNEDVIVILEEDE
tara:strand:+ start:785 stop:1129 length:345 start_codon:yes stop_codon:yes gene_type:complete